MVPAATEKRTDVRAPYRRRSSSRISVRSSTSVGYFSARLKNSSAVRTMKKSAVPMIKKLTRAVMNLP